MERRSRGIYVATDHPHTEKHSLAQVSKRVPAAVVCLISALQLHEIPTQIALEVWIALPEKARKPRLEFPPLRIVRFSGPALTKDVETRRRRRPGSGVYSLAKTVVDCFKYRNKIGFDVALEALREGWWGGRFTLDQIHRLAQACRMERVMRPCLEALVAR